MTGVCGVGVAIAEKSHLTLWLAMSGCQVGGAKEGEKELDFFFFSVPQVMIQPSSPSFIPYCQFGSKLRLLQFIIMKTKKKKKTSQIKNAEQIIFNRTRDKFPFLCVV